MAVVCHKDEEHVVRGSEKRRTNNVPRRSVRRRTKAVPRESVTEPTKRLTRIVKRPDMYGVIQNDHGPLLITPGSMLLPGITKPLMSRNTEILIPTRECNDVA
ncbi:hypothetical protein ACFE04_002646 [Oxalis oulophora]